MCLYSITKQFNPPDTQERFAWKILEEEHSILRTPFRSDPVELNKWLIASTSYTVTCEDYSGKSYIPGFHCYTTENEAIAAMNEFTKQSGHIVYLFRREYWAVYKVSVRKITYLGTDGTSGGNSKQWANVVAEEMKIIEKVIK